jgi:hypothetical protein
MEHLFSSLRNFSTNIEIFRQTELTAQTIIGKLNSVDNTAGKEAASREVATVTHFIGANT